DNSVALLSLAIIQTHAGELQDAIHTLSSAIEKFPSNSQMHYYLGVALEQTLEHDARAAEAFRQTIRLNPSFADSYYHFAKLYLKKDPKLAEQNLLTCLRLDPHHLSAEYSLGRLYLQTGRRVEGRALIDAFERQQQAETLKVQQKPRLELSPIKIPTSVGIRLPRTTVTSALRRCPGRCIQLRSSRWDSRPGCNRICSWNPTR